MPKLTESGDKILEDVAAAIIARLNQGYFRIYAGPKPASPRAALSGNTLLHECRFASPAAPAAALNAGGILITFSALTTASTLASGDASFARLYDSTGAFCLHQLTVGLAADNANITVPAIAIPAGVSWTPGAFSMPIPISTAGV